MLRRTSILLFCTTLAVSAVALSATADAKQKPGDGKTKVVLCHRGKTIRVGLPAVRAHLRHGDTLGRCGAQAPAPQTARLAVVKNVINDSGGVKTPADFTVTINGVAATGGNSFAGSAVAVVRTITTFGAYSVTESSVAGYQLKTASGGCSGTIAAGQDVLCVLTNDDVPATITVVKQVVNDHGGTKSPADFTITISGVTTTSGTTFAGSSAGVTKTLTSVGSYSVTEVAVAGYALQSVSAECAGVVSLGQSKTCVLTNNDV